MLTRKPCKWCGSIWHSKNKCEKREYKAFREPITPKRTNTPLLAKDASERLRLSYKGKSERSQLIGYADKFFSIYIRRRNADSSGMVTCVVCGNLYHWKDVDAGHFIPRRFLATRWDETNVNVECRHDNRDNPKHLVLYEKYIELSYGVGYSDGLRRKSRLYSKITNQDIKDIIKKYEEYN